MVTCSRRLENPAGLRLSPSLFLISRFLVMQMRVGGPANPYIRAGEPVTLLAGGHPLPHCRAAWGAGRPAAGRPGLQGPGRKFSAKVFAEKPLPPGSGAAGVYSCKFRKQKYIFVKTKIEKYKNIKKPPIIIGLYGPVHRPATKL